MKTPTSILLMVFGMSLVFSQPDLTTTLFQNGFSSPVSIQNAGDSRLFIVEQAGVIKILNSDSSVNGTPFLDIDSKVIDLFGPGDENGLLGLAFHPNYDTNGYFFVNYINNAGDSVISRFTVSGDPDIADPNSEVILLTFAQPFFNHNGGDMAFGPDGYLYIASGDGGGNGDPNNEAQNLNSLLGKILRIDVDNGSPYAIPNGNPFADDGDPNTLPEIWAYGLRNPWKISFDSTTGDFWIADVGFSAYEEINVSVNNQAGENYGWRCYEGNYAGNTAGCPPQNTLTAPVAGYDYGGSPFKCAITGGYRYRGSAFTSFQGLYFFADYCSGEVGYIEYNGSSWDMTLQTVTGNAWSTFGVDHNGELYLADLDSGAIYKLSDSNLSTQESTVSSFNMYPNPTKDNLNFQFNKIPTQITLLDIQGKTVNVFTEINANFNITTNHLEQGLYIVEVLSENGTKFHKKLIVNR